MVHFISMKTILIKNTLIIFDRIVSSNTIIDK